MDIDALLLGYSVQQLLLFVDYVGIIHIRSNIISNKPFKMTTSLKGCLSRRTLYRYLANSASSQVPRIY